MTKQVIIIRRDLKMRRGKEISQGAHAAMKWIVDRLQEDKKGAFSLELSETEQEWVKGIFTKVTCQVDSIDELLAIHKKAKDAGLITSIIEDSGKTEFDGPTITAIAIGPDKNEEIDKITGNLKLY